MEGPDALWALAVDGWGCVLTRIADVVRDWAGEDGGKLGFGRAEVSGRAGRPAFWRFVLGWVCGPRLPVTTA